jgi:CheY-like chemotaxis protein
VLVVEDDADTQTYMKTLLAPRYDIVVAASGTEARQHLALDEGEIRIVLMDLSLRGPEDGLSLTRWLRSEARWRTLPVIATTAHAFTEDRLHALAAGCNAYLRKPIEIHELFATMERLIALDGADAPVTDRSASVLRRERL